MKEGPFFVTRRRFDQRCDMLAFVVEALVLKHGKKVRTVLGAQLSAPSDDDMLNIARQARLEGRITTVAYQKLIAQSNGLVKQHVCASTRLHARIPYLSDKDFLHSRGLSGSRASSSLGEGYL